jgi:hypothetical protein
MAKASKPIQNHNSLRQTTNISYPCFFCYAKPEAASLFCMRSKQAEGVLRSHLCGGYKKKAALVLLRRHAFVFCFASCSARRRCHAFISGYATPKACEAALPAFGLRSKRFAGGDEAFLLLI